ncbi:hypothetical protein B0H10DRAFT_2218754 [Mycena sp. CBHHK59/15]|nr:hypothetical protein B0H10DRAFT_2218754 [Mycena sp. CBHHK59/15]
MSLFADINSWDQCLSRDLCSPNLHSENGRGFDNEDENCPPANLYLPHTGGGHMRPGVSYSSARDTGLRPWKKTGTDFGDGPPPGSSVLGRRKRPESMAEWSPPTKARLKTYAEDVASEYRVPESNREDFLNASTLSTHKLMIVTLGVVLGRQEDASSESRLTEYLGSSEFKENVISQIRGVLLDPKIPSYKIGFLDRLMRHIRLNPGVYRIPQEFRAMITTNSFNSAISKAAVNARSDMKRKMANMWHTKSNIYELVNALACKLSQEMTDPIWARFACVQMKLVDYKAKPGPAANGQDGFWDYIDKQLAERRETSLTIPVTNRAAYSSYIFEEALKLHMSLCPPKKKQKSSTQLPKWQEDISRAIEEMESYMQDELAEELPEEDGDAQPDAPGPAGDAHSSG